MQVIYNGIDMSVMQETWQYEMSAVTDDSQVDYLFTRHTIVCRSVVNGAVDVWQGRMVNGMWQRNGPAITYVHAAAPPSPNDFIPSSQRPASISNPVFPQFRNGVPVPPQGSGVGVAPASPLIEVVSRPNRPSLTLQAIRQRLSDPRGKLFITSILSEPVNGGASNAQFLLPYTLQSPEPGMVCDCKNGPFPKLLSIDRVHGNDETYIVTFAIETYVNESFKNGNLTAGVLLSNRFSQTAALDDRSYTTIMTEGRAVFRTDYLYAGNWSPDDFRDILMLKIPQGFKRENLQVTGLPDVTGVAYSFADRQLPVQFPSGPYAKAQKIAAIHRQAVINNASILQGALASYERVLGIAANQNIASAGASETDGRRLRRTPPRQVVPELPAS